VNQDIPSPLKSLNCCCPPPSSSFQLAVRKIIHTCPSNNNLCLYKTVNCPSDALIKGTETSESLTNRKLEMKTFQTFSEMFGNE
jgi:hypothetical protein